MTELSRFTIRVYGIMEWNNQILLVDERIGDVRFTKFPGGGLELGEGIRDCLIREFMEETGMQVDVREHVYTTDFFQQSAFRKTDQLVSVYYRVEALGDPSAIRLDEFEEVFDGRPAYLRFFWVPRTELSEAMVTFPIDKHVARLLS